MDLDALLQPVSDAAPCGPDLNAEVDPEYDDYYFGALGRLPGFYFQPGVERPDGTRSPDRVFDPKDVDIRTEAAAIDALLARSRDLRLLVLRTQWEALSGRLDPMADAVDAIAALIGKFGAGVHPQLADGPADRRDALGDLGSQITIVMPLQFAGLTGTTEVTLRKMKVAQGQMSPLQDEEGLQSGALLDALGGLGYRKQVDASHAAAVRMRTALSRIAQLCQSNADAPFSPAFARTQDTLTEIIELIESARPDLRGAGDPVPEVPQQPVAEPTTEDATGETPAPVMPEGSIANHAEARQVLESCEAYYQRFEPSSAALLLVTQARLLVGRPLVEALQTLLPEQAGQAIVEFGPQSGFALRADRLAQLSQEVAQTQAPAPDLPPAPVIETGAAAAAALRDVEAFFRTHDRSSPVPVLLTRARSYQDRDFQSLVDELIPRQPEG